MLQPSKATTPCPRAQGSWLGALADANARPAAVLLCPAPLDRRPAAGRRRQDVRRILVLALLQPETGALVELAGTPVVPPIVPPQLGPLRGRARVYRRSERSVIHVRGRYVRPAVDSGGPGGNASGRPHHPLTTPAHTTRSHHPLKPRQPRRLARGGRGSLTTLNAPPMGTSHGAASARRKR